MGCCYVFRLVEIHTIAVPVFVDAYCADLAGCLIAQGYEPECARKNSTNPYPVGQARVHTD